MEEKVTRVCKCENCGNEAEMVVTCSLPEAPAAGAPTDPGPGKSKAAHSHRVKGSATCSHCGNEADMWIDI